MELNTPPGPLNCIDPVDPSVIKVSKTPAANEGVTLAIVLPSPTMSKSPNVGKLNALDNPPKELAFVKGSPCQVVADIVVADSPVTLALVADNVVTVPDIAVNILAVLLVVFTVPR